MIIKRITKEQAQRIRTAQDLNDIYAYFERWGDYITYIFPESEQERIDSLIDKMNYKQGEYNADNASRIIWGNN